MTDKSNNRGLVKGVARAPEISEADMNIMFATNVTGTTVVLVAPTGEWTRRRIGDAAAARAFARKRAIPLYDAAVTGYPARMKAWTEARNAAGRCGTPGLRGPS